MLLTITTTHRPATDLGHLLRKNPARSQSFDLTFGRAHVFYPEAADDRCTAALLVEVDPVALVRKRRGPSGEGGALNQYVNDRPYAASSFLSVAIADVFSSALGGHSRERPELAETPIPLRAMLPAVPCRSGEDFLRRLFEPLGYAVTAQRLALDPRFPAWGDSAYHRVELSAPLPLHQLLSHLYVLLPVLDNDKHYWVGDDEVQKLLRHGDGWLAAHPERKLIAARYLKHRRTLVDDALAQLIDESDPHPDDTESARANEEAALENALSAAESATTSRADLRIGRDTHGAELSVSVNETSDRAPTLHEQRLGTVLAVLKVSGAQSVLDLGCGEGKLLRRLLAERQFSRIAGLDVSHRALEIVADKLRLDRMPVLQRERITLLHGALTYRDERLAGFDAAAVVEVIEHLDPPRLAAFERVLFECARPKTVVLTTPNREYNVRWETLPAGKFRHRDHRFEWTRDEFRAWAERVAARFGYTVRFMAIGPEDAVVGAPTQGGVFTTDRKYNEALDVAKGMVSQSDINAERDEQ